MNTKNLKITFFSNYLTHHQVPFCKSMYQKLGDNYTFVCSEHLAQERIDLGYEDLNNKYTFTLNTYESAENYNRALSLGYESDIVIMGSGPKVFIVKRLSDNKLTFYWMERVFKKGPHQLLNPVMLHELLYYHLRYNSKKLYVLCSSAYTAFDFHRLGLHKDKMYSWGYFPKVKTQDLENLLSKKDSSVIKLLWMGRFLDWKHPDHAVVLAHKLRDSGIDFQLDIVGTGQLKKKLENLIVKYNLQDCVFLHGSVSTEEARSFMENSSIYLFTSDFNEGWGAVLNESMNSGCAVVASHAIGAVPLMMKHKKNGLIYKSGDIDHLYELVKSLIEDPGLRENLARQGYKSTVNIWNADVASDRFLSLSEALLNGQNTSYHSGPCSKANIFSHKYSV